MFDQNTDVKYPSKERIVRDDVLIHAEGDDLINDLEEAARQGYEIEEIDPAEIATERIEEDGVLVATPGDVIKKAQPAAKQSKPAKK